MCGIIAGITTSNILPILVGGLEQLEYRGYDSAGLALILSGNIHVVKAAGKVAVLKNLLAKEKFNSNIAPCS